MLSGIRRCDHELINHLLFSDSDSVVVLSVECYQSLQGSHHAALSDCFGFGGVAVRLVSLHSSSLQMIVVYKILVVFVLVVVPLLLG
jgi:hypothetical protein